MGNVLRDPKLNCVQLPGLVKKTAPAKGAVPHLIQLFIPAFRYSPSHGFDLAYQISFLPPAQQIGLELAPKNRMDPAYKSRPRRKIEPGPCKERVLKIVSSSFLLFSITLFLPSGFLAPKMDRVRKDILYKKKQSAAKRALQPIISASVLLLFDKTGMFEPPSYYHFIPKKSIYFLYFRKLCTIFVF